MSQRTYIYVNVSRMILSHQTSARQSQAFLRIEASLHVLILHFEAPSPNPPCSHILHLSFCVWLLCGLPGLSPDDPCLSVSFDALTLHIEPLNGDHLFLLLPHLTHQHIFFRLQTCLYNLPKEKCEVKVFYA